MSYKEKTITKTLFSKRKGALNMVRRSIIASLLIFGMSLTVAQNQEELMQKFLDVFMGPMTNVVIGELPEEIDIELPDTITVLGTVTRGDFSSMPPIPMMPPMMTSHQVYLDSDLGFSALADIFDEIFEAKGYTTIDMNPRPVGPDSIPQWGFTATNIERTQEEFSLFRSYCNDSLNISVDGFLDFVVGPPGMAIADTQDDTSKRLTMNINTAPSASACEEQVVQMEMMQQEMMGQAFPPGMAPPGFEVIERLPSLELTPPSGSLNLTTENIPYTPTPSVRVSGIKITSGWSSRTVLGTPIMGEELRLHYDGQLKDQGWERTRFDVSGPLAWSERRIQGDDGTEWGGFLQIMSDPNWQKGVAMPIFFLLEKP